MICSTTGGTENSRKWSRTYLLTCCPRSVERINIGFAVSRLRHGANERCGTNLREPGGMGQTVVDENSGGLGEPAAVWAQRYKADRPCRNRAGVALRAAFGSSSGWEGTSYATLACGSRRIRDHRSGSGHLGSGRSLAERESYREPARSVPGLLQSGDCLEVPSPALVDGDGRGESGPRATPADGKRQSSGADPRPREHPSQWIPVRQRRELHAADGDLG